MTRRLDPIEWGYKLAMDRCTDSDAALELSIGLRQYREQYKWDSTIDDHEEYSRTVQWYGEEDD